MRIAVLGAGVSGLTAARLLKEKGHDVTVYEKNESVGGLARTRNVNGFLYDPHGGHIFNSKKKDVVDWVFSLLPKENWQFTERNAKIFFDGKYISYPFELSLCELDIDDAVDCVHDFVLSKQGEEPDNFHDWLVWNFGKAIADYYMIPYNEKIWAYPLKDMETKWMQGKMPLPTKKEMIHSMLLKNPTERKMPHSTFYYPLHGGIQTMANAIANGLNIKCSYIIHKIEKLDGKWRVNYEQPFDRIVSTIPLPELPALMKLPDEVCVNIANLKWNSLTTVFFDCAPTNINWLYIPSHEYRSHRVIYQSSLTPHATPSPKHGSGAMEIIGNEFTVDENFAREKNILPSELGFNRVIDHEFTKYAYVIHDKKYRASTEAIKEWFSKDNSFKLLGRWGTWNYKNMDMCMLDAMKLAKEF